MFGLGNIVDIEKVFFKKTEDGKSAEIFEIVGEKIEYRGFLEL